MSKPQYTVISYVAKDTWTVSGEGIWGTLTIEAFTFSNHVEAQVAANTLNEAYARGYMRAQYDIRKALGVEE